MYLARDGTPQVWGCPASPGGFKGDPKSRGAPLPAVQRGGTRQTPPGRFWPAGDLEARPGSRLPPAPARRAPRSWPRSASPASEGAVPVPRRARINPPPAPSGVRSGTGRVPSAQGGTRRGHLPRWRGRILGRALEAPSGRRRLRARGAQTGSAAAPGSPRRSSRDKFQLWEGTV